MSGHKSELDGERGEKRRRKKDDKRNGTRAAMNSIWDIGQSIQ